MICEKQTTLSTFFCHHLLGLFSALYLFKRKRLTYFIHWVTAVWAINVPRCAQFSWAWNIQKWLAVTSLMLLTLPARNKSKWQYNLLLWFRKVKSIFLQSPKFISIQEGKFIRVQEVTGFPPMCQFGLVGNSCCVEKCFGKC